MTGGPTRRGWGALIAAKVVCCGGLLLFVSGALTLNGVLAWFQDGNLAWLAGAGVLVVGVFLWLRRQRRDRSTTERPRQLETKGTP